MAQEKIDRRVRKTRALLLQGLIQLMNEKDIKDISVKELSDLVDINRGTFYLHYNDIYDMLDKVEDELFREFNEILDRNLTEQTKIIPSNAILLDIFSFLEKNYDISKVMLGPHGDLAFVNRLKELVKERLRHILELEHAGENLEYFYSFIVSGFVGIIETWLNHENPLPPEKIADLCWQLLRNGIASQNNSHLEG